MDINFFLDDPEMAPKPRDEIRITSLAASPMEDGRRIRVMIEITPFTPADRPSLLIAITGSEGTVLSETSVIETDQYRVSLTMHLHQALSAEKSQLELHAALYFEPEKPQHVMSIGFSLTEGD